MHPTHLRRLVPAALLAFPLLLWGCGSESAASDAPVEEAVESPAPATAASEAPAVDLAVDELPQVKVYKTPTCGCCEDWIEHLRAEGFAVEVEDQNDLTPLKNMLGIPVRLRSCHTATVGKYLVEGHVSASDIKRLLSEAPQVAGIATPGMPIGSPGRKRGAGCGSGGGGERGESAAPGGGSGRAGAGPGSAVEAPP